MKVLLFIFFLGFELLGSDLITLYRNGDMAAIQQALETRLQSPEYWSEYLKDKPTDFGYFENLNTLLLCNKKEAKLHVYYRSKEKPLELVQSYKAMTGKINGDKKTEGDYKTPVGIYSLTKKLDKLDPFYGPMAYVTSYPNLYDRIRGKNGSGIWIHGLPLNGERDAYTRGCIAIENEDIVCLDEAIAINKTMLVVTEEHYPQTDKTDYAEILAQLFQWRNAWIQNDIKRYLEFYDKRFKRYDGKGYRQFSDYKQRVFSYNDTKDILFENIKIFPYPESNEKLYAIYFDEAYRSKRTSFNGSKNLIVALDSSRRMRIIAEK